MPSLLAYYEMSFRGRGSPKANEEPGTLWQVYAIVQPKCFTIAFVAIDCAATKESAGKSQRRINEMPFNPLKSRQQYPWDHTILHSSLPNSDFQR
jgi:hypothetical protein